MLGARGQTHSELTQLLGYQPQQSSVSLYQDFQRLMAILAASNSNLEDSSDGQVDHYVKVANGLFLQNGFSLNPDYKSVVQSIYKADTFSVDFGSPSVVQQVNQWVSSATRGKVSEILSKRLDHNTKMVLASTVYFNARWQTTFYESLTKPRPFWLEGRDQPSTQVEMMALGGKFPFYDAPEYNCRMLALPYKNSTSTMYILLPNNSSREAVQNLHRQLSAEIINQMIAKMVVSSAIVFLPKMHLTSTTDIQREISGFGVQRLFDPQAADLGLIVNGGEAQNGITGGFANGAVLQPQYPSHLERLEDVLIFSRFNEEHGMMAAEKGEKDGMRMKRNTYKTTSEVKKSESPLKMKDFILRKRITKESKVGKKAIRHRRQVDGLTVQATLNALQALERQRGGYGSNPGLFANEILHKVDLIINEKGTEGGAATLVTLNKSGTDVVFKVEEPFLFFIRHEASQLPLFYGAVFDPRSS